MLRAIKALLPKGRRRILLGPARGAIMPLDLAHGMRLYLGLYERELHPHFRRLLRPGMRAFDVGCANGYCALLIHNLTGAEVVGFEAGDVGLASTFAANSPMLHAIQAFVGTAPHLTLDEAAERYFVPDFIKIDVEGAEADVLRSCPKVLAHRPALIIEVHGEREEADCIAILRANGYTIEVVNQGRFRERRPMAHNRWLVCH